MSRPSSIPHNLQLSIVRRYIQGNSIRSILKWIEETNAERPTPVKTTTSSILRCVTRAGETGAPVACVSAVNRVRLEAPHALDQWEEADEGYRQCVADADGGEEKRRAIPAKLQGLKSMELSAYRKLRVAGIGGASSERLLKQYAPQIDLLARCIGVENHLEDDGLPPECFGLELPKEFIPNDPLPEDRYQAARFCHEDALARVAASAATEPQAKPVPEPAPTQLTLPTVSAPAAAEENESISRQDKQIDDVKRHTSPLPDGWVEGLSQPPELMVLRRSSADGSESIIVARTALNGRVQLFSGHMKPGAQPITKVEASGPDEAWARTFAADLIRSWSSSPPPDVIKAAA